MYKISIYGCAMFKKLVCQWANKHFNRATVKEYFSLYSNQSLQDYDMSKLLKYLFSSFIPPPPSPKLPISEITSALPTCSMSVV